MGTLIAYSGDVQRYLGYAVSGEFDGLYVGIKESPIIRLEGMFLVAVLNNRHLQQYLYQQKIKPPDTSYNGVLNAFEFTREVEKFSQAQMLMISVDGSIFYWKDGFLYDIKGRYFSIGDGRDTALGCMYGLRASNYNDQERMEITLKAVAYSRPNYSISTGVEKI